MKIIFKAIPSLFLGFLYFIFSFNLQAQYLTEQSLLEAFEQQQKTTKVNDTQRVKHLQPFLEVATKNHWQNAWVEIQKSKAILYSGLYQLQALMNTIHETLPVATKLKLFDDIAVLEALWLEASLYSNTITANVSAKELLNRLPKIKDKFDKERVRLYLSIYFLEQGDLLTSLQLTLSLNGEDVHSKAQKAEKLAHIYFRVGDMEKYNNFSVQAITLFEEVDDLSAQAIAMYNRIITFFLKDDFDEIEIYLPKFEQAVEVAGDITLLGDVLRFKGMMALHQQDYSLAKSLLNKSKLIYQAHDLGYYVMSSDLVLLETILLEGDFLTAKDKLLVIKPDVVSYANSYDFHKYYQLVTTIHKGLNDYKSALEAAEHLKRYELLLAKEKNQTEIIKFEYEQSLKDQKIEKVYMQAQQSQQNTIWALIIIIAVLTLFFLTLVLYKQMSAKQKLRVLANTDVLTGAPNRRAILNEAEQQFRYCKEKQLPLVIALADIDLFKLINDEFGHDIGDEVLKVFSDCSKQVIRQSEFYGRFGGEEWLFVLPQTKITFAPILFERLYQATEKCEDVLPFNKKRITFSMGAVEIGEGDTLKTMIDRADKLLYQAKENGRNCICS